MAKKTVFYVMHDEGSSHDPTYGTPHGMLLVEGYKEVEENGHNPCSPDRLVRKCDLMPTDAKGLRLFARAFGFDVQEDNEGQLILYTGISARKKSKKQ